MALKKYLICLLSTGLVLGDVRAEQIYLLLPTDRFSTKFQLVFDQVSPSFVHDHLVDGWEAALIFLFQIF
jgi:hypothetical protein